MSNIQRAEVNGNTVAALDLFRRPVAAEHLVAGGTDSGAPMRQRSARTTGVWR